LAGLLALQIKFFLPLMYKVAASDLFLVDSKDSASSLPVSNDMTELAFSHCNSYIKNDLGEETNVVFASQPTNVWSLGNYEYIVNADLELTPKDQPGASRHYVCRIQYANGDDVSGATNLENWSVEGVSGLSE
jgi:hypothetical protein